MNVFLRSPALRKFGLPLIALAVVLVVAAVLLARGKELDERHSPLAFPETFAYDTGSFADYMAYSERLVRTAHPDADATLIANLGSFRLEPPQDCPASTSATYLNGVVLTHELLETPYSLRQLGRYFQERCFLVYAPLLPGHGTRPGALLNTEWESWVDAERMAARSLAAEVENVYLGGHGVGGTLAILEASTNTGVDGLVLFAPALATRASSWQASAGALVGWLAPGARWADLVPAYTPYRYASRPYRLTGASNAVIRAMEAALPTRPFEVPVFTVASQEDMTVSTPAILAFMAQRVHPLSKTVLFGRQIQPAGPGQVTFDTYFPDRGILSLSHLGLMVPTFDPEFGRRGASRDCGHYYRSNPEAYALCMDGKRVALGEISPEQLAEVDGPLERIEYNPYYYEMIWELDDFIAPVARIPVNEAR